MQIFMNLCVLGREKICVPFESRNPVLEARKGVLTSIHPWKTKGLFYWNVPAREGGHRGKLFLGMLLRVCDGCLVGERYQEEFLLANSVVFNNKKSTCNLMWNRECCAKSPLF